MEEVGRVFDVSRHEAGHAFAFWRQGGKVKSVIAARSGFSDGIPLDCLGICGGEFRDSSLVMNDPAKIVAEKMLAVLFSGGIADGNPGSTVGDMGMAILSMGWPAQKYPVPCRDAVDLIEKYGQDIPTEERVNFFKKHAEAFSDILKGDDAEAAVTKLTHALNNAQGHMVRGGDVAEIFEKIYEGKRPAEALPVYMHGEPGDRIDSPERALDDLQFHLNFMLKRLDDTELDDRIECARVAIIQALLRVSFLM